MERLKGRLGCGSPQCPPLWRALPATWELLLVLVTLSVVIFPGSWAQAESGTCANEVAVRQPVSIDGQSAIHQPPPAPVHPSPVSPTSSPCQNAATRSNADRKPGAAERIFPLPEAFRAPLMSPPPMGPDANNIQPPPPPFSRNRYNWKGLLLQSLEFNVLENGFRIASDNVIRDLLAHKPFWHDWMASMKQFNMHRWNDGDDFLVNYVGHTMQGAVTSRLEIQNSPADARLRWGDPGYARSLFKGFLWATVYSTHSEISPLGEAGIGNEGGFTYGTKCLYHCNSNNFKPGDHYTNNTGWVDFLVTPTAGTLWVIAEDVLDKKVSDRVQGEDRTRIAPKILRGALNPARTFTNFQRGKLPWYRDYEHPAPHPPAVYFLPAEEAWSRRNAPRFTLSPHFSGISLAANTPACFNCRRMTGRGGVEFTARLGRGLEADMDLSYQPGASPLPSDRAGGNLLAGFFGIRGGWESENYALKLALRPGFMRYDRAYLTSPRTIVIQTSPPRIGTSGAGPASTEGPGVVDANGTPDQPALGDITHFAWNVNLTGDYKLSRSFAIRAGIGEDLVRYRTDKVNEAGIGEPPYYSWLAKDNFINRGNWSYQIGPVVSF